MKVLKNYHIVRPLIGVAFFLVLAAGCRKQDGNAAGIEVQPEDQLLGFEITDTFSITCVTKDMDSIRSDQADVNSIGSYHDPVFGKVAHSTVAQIRLSSETIDADLLSTFQVDSVVLSLAYFSLYGEFDPQTFEVYRLTEDLGVDTFYSNHVAQVESTPIGLLKDHKPNTSLVISVDGEEEVPELRIPIDSAFGRELFDAGASVYSSNENFLDVFKGLYITTNNPSQSSGEGATILFDLLSEYSRLTVFYKNNIGERGKLDYVINSNSKRFSTSKADYTGSEVGMALDNPAAGQQTVYVQTLGGTNVEIKVPNIKKLKENGPVVINKAQLILPVKTNTAVPYAPIPQLFVFGLTADGEAFRVPDWTETFYGGVLDDNFEYKFGLNRYFQAVLNGDFEDNGLIVMDLGEYNGRSIINGPASADRPMKLVVSYTPVNETNLN
ncbi:DUF4270 family protein [bacterium SCSIO 12741]|nr:DUF4270 family protein [bacterium SCSIO 12741]